MERSKGRSGERLKVSTVRLWSTSSTVSGDSVSANSGSRSALWISKRPGGLCTAPRPLKGGRGRWGMSSMALVLSGGRAIGAQYARLAARARPAGNLAVLHDESVQLVVVGDRIGGSQAGLDLAAQGF